jgi:hypothetical protein
VSTWPFLYQPKSPTCPLPKKGGAAPHAFKARRELHLDAAPILVNWLAKAVNETIADLNEIAKNRQFTHAKSAAKVNAKGELVIAMILPSNYAAPWVEGESHTLPTREAKRLARVRRG